MDMKMDETNTGEKILDIGCSYNKIPGAKTLDINPDVKPDIVHDLNKYPYPIADGSFDKVYAKHVIEHLNDPAAFLKEIQRILKSGGTVFVETPHFSSRVAYSEPQHKFFFSYFMFDNILNGLNFAVLSQKITFYKTFRACGIAYLANKFPDTYERFWTYIFPAENVSLLAKKK